MGHLFSCRRRARHSSERDPILARDTSTAFFHLRKIAEALGALNAGKYPSQDQINQALRRLLRSELLKPDDLASRTKPSASGARLLSTFREALQVAMEIGLEKNGGVLRRISVRAVILIQRFSRRRLSTTCL